MPARLTLHFPHRPARVCRFPERDGVVVGRDAACAVRLDDDRVSRRHARLDHDGERWALVDLESKNGTKVDGVEVEAIGQTPLGDSAWLSFGGVLARFQTIGEAAEASDQERFRTSVELQRELSPTLGLEPLLERVLDSTIRVSGAERAFVLLKHLDGEDGGDLEVRARRGLDPPKEVRRDTDPSELGFHGSLGAVKTALETRAPVVTCDAREDTWLGHRASVIGEDIRALVCVPLVAGERQVGAIYADSTTPGSTFTELDVEVLEALAHHAALAISVAQLDAELATLREAIDSRQAAEVERVAERLARLRGFDPSPRAADARVAAGEGE